MSPAEYGRRMDDISRVNPESITVVGSVENDGLMSEADVTFSDMTGQQWYITIQTADQHALDVVSGFETIEPDDFMHDDGATEAEEPRKFVWNGNLDDKTIVQILGGSSLAVLRGYVVPVNPDDSSLDEK